MSGEYQIVESLLWVPKLSSLSGCHLHLVPCLLYLLEMLMLVEVEITKSYSEGGPRPMVAARALQAWWWYFCKVSPVFFSYMREEMNQKLWRDKFFHFTLSLYIIQFRYPFHEGSLQPPNIKENRIIYLYNWFDQFLYCKSLV